MSEYLVFLLISNTIFEAAAAFILIWKPGLFLERTDALTKFMARLGGAGSLTMAYLSATLMRLVDNPEAIRIGLLPLAVFHVSVTLVEAQSYNERMLRAPLVIIHFIFAVMFIVMLLSLNKNIFI